MTREHCHRACPLTELLLLTYCSTHRHRYYWEATFDGQFGDIRRNSLHYRALANPRSINKLYKFCACARHRTHA